MDIAAIRAVATAVRTISMDAVQRARSGHPGQPMGCAELGALLYGEILSHYPGDPAWPNRDRFVLSAGHGALLQYALLHLCGYDISLKDLETFRRLGSKATGHPEYAVVPGVEVTTGPLGQGMANAVGMAIAERMLAARFNAARVIIDHYTYGIVGDGDLMEGVSYEASSLAGHLGLGKLILFYDSNGITIEGSTKLCFTEDIRGRFRACNWQVLEGSAYDIPRILRFARMAKREAGRPTLIIMKSVIAKGSPNLAGSHEAHGAPLGEEEVRASKRAMGVPEDSEFYVPREASAYFSLKRPAWEEKYRQWQETFQLWARENPGKHAEWLQFHEAIDPGSLQLPRFSIGEQLPTRTASGKILEALAGRFHSLVGGSADLLHSTSANVKGMDFFSADNPRGTGIHFGIREHAMAAIANGIAVNRPYRVFISTYLVFSDYMRPSIRLAAMMKLPVTYIFTHDSVFLGEDGPTHQPVEHLASLRAIPGLTVLRPGDAEETRVAWEMAISSAGPTCLILSRQPLTVYTKDDAHWEESLRHGAYVVSDSIGKPGTVLVASGSEVNLALETKDSLGATDVRVVSVMCRELFLRAPQAFREKIVPPGTRRAVIEAGVSQGWEGLAGDSGLIFSIESFGTSAPLKELKTALGFVPQAISARIKSWTAS
jgi:transketolase